MRVGKGWRTGSVSWLIVFKHRGSILTYPGSGHSKPLPCLCIACIVPNPHTLGPGMITGNKTSGKIWLAIVWAARVVKAGEQGAIARPAALVQCSPSAPDFSRLESCIIVIIKFFQPTYGDNREQVVRLNPRLLPRSGGGSAVDCWGIYSLFHKSQRCQHHMEQRHTDADAWVTSRMTPLDLCQRHRTVHYFMTM